MAGWDIEDAEDENEQARRHTICDGSRKIGEEYVNAGIVAMGGPGDV